MHSLALRLPHPSSPRPRRALCLAILFLLCPLAVADTPLTAVLEQAERLEQLQTLIIAQRGEILAERGYSGHRTTTPSNIKSASKSVISALVGIAIDKGVIESLEQPIAELLPADLPGKPDPRLHQVTVGNLLSMQAGLGSTSGRNYGAWVANRNWVRAALARPFEADPGTAMIYSTGSSHLLSAILTRRTGKSTLQLARQWLAPLDGFTISAWTRDPQGIYLGGNEMAMNAPLAVGLWRALPPRRAHGLERTAALAGLDRSVLDTPHPLALHRTRLRLWLVHHRAGRRSGSLWLGLWWADGLRGAGPRYDGGDDLQHHATLQRRHGPSRRAAPAARRHHRRAGWHTGQVIWSLFHCLHGSGIYKWLFTNGRTEARYIYEFTSPCRHSL
ncbi:serine hydrolase domain-containing protein [Stutzerimonas zhaodongensis]|uniref:serine hydrolase domain-containing protein n=1 Tax=Stutzerimonas zhaodongensis TaxID=1176257 RepID=UPI003CCC1FEA